MRLRRTVVPALALLAGFGIGVWFTTDPPPRPGPTTCRPSAPQKIVEKADTMVLYLGNSIIFDHGWQLPGTVAVNCARQGQTAKEADPGGLPSIAPGLVVIGFGTVELLRDGTDGHSVSSAKLAAGITKLVDQVAARYPEAHIVILAIPPAPAIAPAAITALNIHLEAYARDAGYVWSPNPEATTYDGVHLTAESYAPWESVITDLAAGLYKFGE